MKRFAIAVALASVLGLSVPSAAYAQHRGFSPRAPNSFAMPNMSMSNMHMNMGSMRFNSFAGTRMGSNMNTGSNVNMGSIRVFPSVSSSPFVRHFGVTNTFNSAPFVSHFGVANTFNTFSTFNGVNRGFSSPNGFVLPFATNPFTTFNTFNGINGGFSSPNTFVLPFASTVRP